MSNAAVTWEEPELPVGDIDPTTRREIADRVAAENTNWADALREYGRAVARAQRESSGRMRQNQGVLEVVDS